MSLNLMDSVRAKAKANPQKVAFPEAGDAKMLEAINEISVGGYGEVYIVGNPEEIKTIARENGFDDSSWKYIDVEDEAFAEDVLQRYLKLPNIIYGEKSLRRRMKDPLYLALMMEAVDDVDVTFGGFFSSTGDIIYAAQTIVGLKSGIETISSVGIADMPNYEFANGTNMLAVGDCAVCTNPSATELASIAISTCDTIRDVTGWEPKCALLSYSSDGSGQGELVEKVQTALNICKEKRPDLKIDGEFQFDSAIVPEVAAKKIKRESEVAGQANIVIFPDLNAGNIGVKLIQQFGKANVYGPLLQGFRKVCSDCSRSAPVGELVGNILFSIVRAGEMKNEK